MAIHNSLPILGVVVGEPPSMEGIFYAVQSGAEDNQGTSPTPFESSWSFQYGEGGNGADGQRMGVRFQGSPETTTP